MKSGCAGYLTEPLAFGKPYLGSLSDVFALFSALLERYFSLVQKNEEGLLSDEGLSVALDADVKHLASGFAGLDTSSFALIGAWNGRSLAFALLRDEPEAVFFSADQADPLSVVSAVIGALIDDAFMAFQAFRYGHDTAEQMNAELNRLVLGLSCELVGLDVPQDLIGS
ncbi:hypothetical protein HK15_01455 [Acetobacter orientalis]|uniref:Uncharacterized protein n=1 Tax=Acetobacter orientalis TaxID=146474 RepID=A0A252BFD5_9PROT|nr:hypothetical protein [Acetobacter orientalis]OUJ03117.1 hypothetical protein HK15_01455 [Acetobacter orientalis]